MRGGNGELEFRIERQFEPQLGRSRGGQSSFSPRTFGAGEECDDEGYSDDPFALSFEAEPIAAPDEGAVFVVDVAEIEKSGRGNPFPEPGQDVV